MNQHKYRANTADASAMSDHDLDDTHEGGIKKPLLLVVALHVIAVAGLLIFAKFNATQVTDTGDSANDYRYTEAVDPALPTSPTQEAVGAQPVNDAETRPLTYVVKSGDMLQKIARRYGVDVQELAILNNMSALDIPAANTVLKLPQSAAATALMANNDAGENPADIREAMSSAPRAQPTSSPTQLDGVPVMRAQPVGADSATPAPTESNSGKTYKVKAGDTLSKIARTNGVKLDALQKANGITDPTKIRVGQTLKLP